MSSSPSPLKLFMNPVPVKKYACACTLLLPTLPLNWYNVLSPKNSLHATTMVLTRGMSTPFSITVVARRTSASPPANLITLASIGLMSGGVPERSSEATESLPQEPFFIRPCATSTLTPGTFLSKTSRRDSSMAIRGATKNTCPPLLSSNCTALTTVSTEKDSTEVFMGIRPSGQVLRVLVSLSPLRLICKVLGIGVALRVRTSIPSFVSFMRSFCFTPNRCSSSITRRPTSLNSIFLPRRARVPITMSAAPEARMCSPSAGVRMRPETTTGTSSAVVKSRARSACSARGRAIGAISSGNDQCEPLMMLTQSVRP